ncbi:MAG: hypothetical protein V1678_02915 [Candidatus Aenigmatarchaeota archaeon]
MNCPKCNLIWTPRKPNPRECPRCKTRFDYGKWKLTPEPIDHKEGASPSSL